MRAVMLSQPRTAQLVEVPDPVPAGGQVLVRTRLAGLCGSDMHAYLGSQPFFIYPQVPGHEVVGEVVTADPPSSGLNPGQRVVLDPTLSCGHCRPCRLGRYNTCVDIRVMGVHAPGVLAELFVAPPERLHPVPDSVPDEVAVLAEPLSIAYHAADRSGLAAGDQVAIIGAGPIGLALVLMARARGARCLITDLESARLNLARRMGAEAAVSAATDDPLAAVAAWTDGAGVPVAIEAVGSPATIRLAVEMTGPASRVVILGLCQEEVSLPASMFVRKELEVVGSRLHQDTVEKVVALLAAGALDPRPVLSDIRPLAAFQSAFDDLERRPSDFLKIALRP